MCAMVDVNSVGGKLLSNTMEALDKRWESPGGHWFQLWQRCAYRFTPTMFLLLMCGLGIALDLSPPMDLKRRETWLETSVSIRFCGVQDLKVFAPLWVGAGHVPGELFAEFVLHVCSKGRSWGKVLGKGFCQKERDCFGQKCQGKHGQCCSGAHKRNRSDGLL